MKKLTYLENETPAEKVGDRIIIGCADCKGQPTVGTALPSKFETASRSFSEKGIHEGHRMILIELPGRDPTIDERLAHNLDKGFIRYSDARKYT